MKKLLIVAIGVFFIIVGVATTKSGKDFEENALITDAIVSRVWEEVESDDGGVEYHYYAEVKYTVDSQNYEGKLSIDSHTYKQIQRGDTMTIFYHPEKPSKIAKGLEDETNQGKALSLVGWVWLGVCLLMGIVRLVRGR